MVNVTISLVIFFLTVILHIIIHRVLLKFSYENYKIFIPIFIFGFIVNIYVNLFISDKILIGTIESNWWAEKLVLSSVLFYILLTAAFFVFFLSPLGQESPSSVILLLVRKAKKLTGDRILSKFSDEILIKKRLDYLITLGWIRKKNKMYSILPKGTMIAAKVLIYRKVIGWKKFG